MENTLEIKPQTKAERLKALGMDAASKEVNELSSRKRKLAIAYEHYRFVRKEKIEVFQQRLKEKTYKRSEFGNTEWQELSFTSLNSYKKVPPEDVLLKLEEAHGHKCFDVFEIAHIKRVKDPILFGRIKGCTDRFFVGQWDDDVKIEDILKDNEG